MSPSGPGRWAALALLSVAVGAAGCGDDAPSSPALVVVASPTSIDVHLSEIVDAEGQGSITIDISGGSSESGAAPAEVRIHLDGAPRVLELDARFDEPGWQAELSESGATVDPGHAYDSGIWFRPRPVTGDVAVLELQPTGPGGPELARGAITIWVRGGPPPVVVRERSLVWTDPAIVDDPASVGFAKVLAAASPDGHGGVMLDRWFRRFATTPHSERAGPAQLMDETATAQGPDPSAWQLDQLPFIVTAVHNRHDLGPRAGDCGELRVSFASTHPVYAPLHLIFLFRQPAAPDDVSPFGERHCLGTARRWAELSALDHDAFVGAARAWLDEGLVRERFVLAETVELTVSPWEWRQWSPLDDDPQQLDNPSLFQTVATAALNQPGPLRDDFLAWAASSAEALAARAEPIPAKFRPPVAQAPPSAPREELDLTGIDPAVLAEYPDLAHDIEIVGCPTCHTDDAHFVHTTPQRTFSRFYDKELDARAVRLDRLNEGELEPMPPFGPLQPENLAR